MTIKKTDPPQNRKIFSYENLFLFFFYECLFLNPIFVYKCCVPLARNEQFSTASYFYRMFECLKKLQYIFLFVFCTVDVQ